MDGECRLLISPFRQDVLSLLFNVLFVFHQTLHVIHKDVKSVSILVSSDQQSSSYYIRLNPRCTYCRIERTMRSRL